MEQLNYSPSGQHYLSLKNLIYSETMTQQETDRIIIRGAPWRLVAERDSNLNKKQFWIYLKCDEGSFNDTNTWQYNIKATFSVYSSRFYIISERIEHKFCIEQDQKGFCLDLDKRYNEEIDETLWNENSPISIVANIRVKRKKDKSKKRKSTKSSSSSSSTKRLHFNGDSSICSDQSPPSVIVTNPSVDRFLDCQDTSIHSFQEDKEEEEEEEGEPIYSSIRIKQEPTFTSESDKIYDEDIMELPHNPLVVVADKQNDQIYGSSNSDTEYNFSREKQRTLIGDIKIEYDVESLRRELEISNANSSRLIARQTKEIEKLRRELTMALKTRDKALKKIGNLSLELEEMRQKISSQ